MNTESMKAEAETFENQPHLSRVNKMIHKFQLYFFRVTEAGTGGVL